VSQEEYYQEMRNSRICVSPFGFGEICWRDFETVLCGALLIKPDMSHVETAPNIFVANKTYVPVKWDFSDLESVVARVLHNEAERRRIVDNAYNALSSYYETGAFAKTVDRLLK
jgi:spore germination protein YaaH